MPFKGPRHSAGANAAPPETATYALRDIVLAKVKGHQAWPARIIDPHKAPANLQDERKMSQKNSYLVKFFQTGDHAWMNAKEMSKLDPPEIKAFIDNPHKKGADLRAAYEIAMAPEEWEADVEAASREYEEHLKSLEMDELEGENSSGPTLPSKGKPKRKRTAEAKTPSESAKKRKAEVLQPNNGSVNASDTPESTPMATTKRRGRKKAEPVPAAIVASAEVVRDWRHKLQRIFLGKTEVTDAMMPDIDQTFKDIEKCTMETEWLTSSKLGKVLKRIGALEDGKVPLDDEYQIRARSRQLQETWRVSLGIGEEAQRAPAVAEASNDPADIPTGSADAAVKAEEEPAAPSLPPINDESMDVDQSTSLIEPVPTTDMNTESGTPPEAESSHHASEKQLPTQTDPASQEEAIKSEAGVVASEDGEPIELGDAKPVESVDEKPVTNGDSAHQEDTEMDGVAAKSDVAADDVEEEEDKMDLAGSTPPEEPVEHDATSQKNDEA